MHNDTLMHTRRTSIVTGAAHSIKGEESTFPARSGSTPQCDGTINFFEVRQANKSFANVVPLIQLPGTSMKGTLSPRCLEY